MKLFLIISTLCLLFGLIQAEVEGEAKTEAETVKLPPSDVVPYGNIYAYEPPRINPEYCQGFAIEYPIAPGLAFEMGSTQELHWAVNKSVALVPDYIVRIRLINSTQHHQYIIQGVSYLYTKDNKGAISFPLKAQASSGIYHYRIVVNYPNQAIHCVYESVPFTLIGNPYKSQVIAGAPYPYTNPEGKFLTAPVPDFGMTYPLGS